MPTVFGAGHSGDLLTTPTFPDVYFLARQGLYFKAMNPTPGTGLAANIQTSFLATKGLLNIRNNTAAGGPSLYLDYLRLICTVAPASATAAELVLALDSSVRWSSGGTNITALPNANMESSRASGAVLYVGALTLATASANVRYTGRAKWWHAIEVVGSETLLLFNRPQGEQATLNGTAPVRTVISVGPVVLGPGANHNLSIHDWRPANAVTAASYEFELGWWED